MWEPQIRCVLVSLHGLYEYLLIKASFGGLSKFINALSKHIGQLSVVSYIISTM